MSMDDEADWCPRCRETFGTVKYGALGDAERELLVSVLEDSGLDLKRVRMVMQHNGHDHGLHVQLLKPREVLIIPRGDWVDQRQVIG